MTNDDEKTQTMDSECLGEEIKKTKNTATNRIINGKCGACSSEDVDSKSEVIQCYWCKNSFHAIECSNDQFNVSAPSVFKNHLHAAVNNASPYEKRFGRFLFICNDCITLEEKRQAAAKTDRVELLDMKIDSFKREFKEEILEMKALLKNQFNGTPRDVSKLENETVADNQTKDKLLWSQRVENLKHLVTLKSQAGEQKLCQKTLEKTCAESGASVIKTFSMRKTKDTAIVCNSRKDAEKLLDKIENTFPSQDAELVTALKPEVNIVGLGQQYDPGQLKDMLIKQNSGITNLYGDESALLDDKHISVISVTPLKSYKGKQQSLYKSTVRVSNLIREIIAKQGDRVYLGSNSHKVYDSFYIPRCYKCQDFHHLSKKCEAEHPTCGFCAEQHDTQTCPKKDDSSNTPTCINCKNSDSHKSDASHYAGSFDCPMLKEKQLQLKKRIPFYQQHQ